MSYKKNNDSSNLRQYSKLFWFSLVVVGEWKPRSTLQSGILILLWLVYSWKLFSAKTVLVVVLKALCSLRCHYSRDSMSFFLPLLGWSRFQGREKREDREPPCSWGLDAITCGTLGIFFFLPFLPLFSFSFWQPKLKGETNLEYKRVWCNIKLWSCGDRGRAVGKSSSSF